MKRIENNLTQSILFLRIKKALPGIDVDEPAFWPMILDMLFEKGMIREWWALRDYEACLRAIAERLTAEKAAGFLERMDWTPARIRKCVVRWVDLHFPDLRKMPDWDLPGYTAEPLACPAWVADDFHGIPTYEWKTTGEL
jgi:hypothetical protein